MDAAGQAAWVQGIGTILAVVAAFCISFLQIRHEKNARVLNERKMVMSTAANLAVALSYTQTAFAFAPTGDGVIGHDFSLEQAREFMKLSADMHEALHNALDKAHYFPETLCEQIVLLNIKAAAYDRIIDELARWTPKDKVDEFFIKTTNTKVALQERLENVRQLLQNYLPKEP